jgi:hypothetical protein
MPVRVLYQSTGAQQLHLVLLRSNTELCRDPLTTSQLPMNVTLTMSCTIDMSQLGSYELTLYLANATDDNDRSPALQASFQLLDNRPRTMPYLQNFEQCGNHTYIGQNVTGVDLDHCSEFDFGTSSAVGRLRTMAANGRFARSGNHSITLDSSRNGVYATNLLVLTLNLASYGSPLTGRPLFLGFSFLSHGDESDSMDRVWIRGDETQPMVSCLGLNGHTTGRYESIENIPISRILAQAMQSYTATFQVMLPHREKGT